MIIASAIHDSIGSVHVEQSRHQNYCLKFSEWFSPPPPIPQAMRPLAQAENKDAEHTPLSLFNYFVGRCRENLHVILAFSPIGDAFRNRMRKFPSLINCCTIDWFQAWPDDALGRFLTSIIKWYCKYMYSRDGGAKSARTRVVAI